MWEGGGAKESEVQTEGSHGEGGETSPSKQAQASITGQGSSGDETQAKIAKYESLFLEEDPTDNSVLKSSLTASMSCFVCKWAASSSSMLGRGHYYAWHTSH